MYQVTKGKMRFEGKGYQAGDFLPESFTERDRARSVYSKRIRFVQTVDAPVAPETPETPATPEVPSAPADVEKPADTVPEPKKPDTVAKSTAAAKVPQTKPTGTK